MGVGSGSGGDVSDGELWGAALLTPLLTSCCVAWFLSGHGPVPVPAQGLGTPALRGETETQTHGRKHGGNGHDTGRRKLG